MRHIIVLLLAMIATGIHAEDGSRLWMRYKDGGTAAVMLTTPESATSGIAVRELKSYWHGGPVTLTTSPSLPGSNDAYTISYATDTTRVKARTDTGLLYAAYDMLRRQALGMHSEGVVTGQPRFQMRMLNHWDNLDGSIERGYAGKSIFTWFSLDKAKIEAYARANASIGINATVLNNVNASPKMLTTEYLREVRTIADILRPYGLRVYLSVNFATPMSLGHTHTADPLDKSVSRWWTRKAREIYRLIPDFGGFLVKANSEGQPGPGDYGRSHAEGANMLARALKPHGGQVIWRSFVYGANHKGEDRVKQAVSEFEPCDGLFLDNVILQSKNGPLDFQPREPYAPIFDRISKTTQMAELQITQEYLGQSLHLVYLAPMWKEFFSFVSPDKLRGVAGVANIGDDKNWCGHHFSQANWYAYGRLAWDPDLSAEDIAREWIGQTFDADSTFTTAVTDIMMTSREACVDYMMPLGLHHIFMFDHHYGPEPQGFKAEYPLEWCPVYYHNASKDGIGFDRTQKSGSGATAQYRQPYAQLYENINTCPEQYLLWFHHLPWDYRMNNGMTLWENICKRYDEGVRMTHLYRTAWSGLRYAVDSQRWKEVDERLAEQTRSAEEWRATCIEYFNAKRTE